MEQKECECGCGQKIRAFTRNGKTRHYARGHGNTAAVDTVCARCQKPIRVRKWQIEKFGRSFCGHKCSGEAHVVRADFECHHCKKPFTAKPWKRKGQQVFCTYACSVAHREFKPDRKIEVQCSGCSKPLRVYPSRFRLNQNFYCTTTCRAEHIIGRNNPSYRSGRGRNARYGPNWRRQRRATLLRDDKRCQYCQKRPKTTRRLHVHHIRPFYEFGDDYLSANDLLNLITLCHLCHKKAERGAIVIQARLL